MDHGMLSCIEKCHLMPEVTKSHHLVNTATFGVRTIKIEI